MNFSKFGNMHKLIAVALTLVALIFVFGFAVSGSLDGDEPTEPTEPNDDGGSTNAPDENEDNRNDEETVVIPQYISYITGLECTEESSYTKPFAFVMSSLEPAYGISDAELVIEIPTENKKTRYLVYTNGTTRLGKIGAIAQTRDYISSLTSYFGGILTAYGNDDLIEYSQNTVSGLLDLSLGKEYYYTENAYNIYTDMDKLSELIKKNGVETETRKTVFMPYRFAEYGELVTGNAAATSITIPYLDKTQFTYNTATGEYLLSKADRQKIDMLSGKAASFTNVFILFADSTTYERSEGIETVYDTQSGGYGYYASGGRLTEIRWSTDSDGNLVFRDLSGDILTVNRGKNYIAFYKSSTSGDIMFE